MSHEFDLRLNMLARQPARLLANGLKGIEKEALRVDPDGFLAQTSHPAAFGSPLTNRYLTTDFSEALLEFVTPAFRTTSEALRAICDVHRFAYANLADELLWATSMPCRIPEDDKIPLARYGTSNVAQMKTAYRRGLGHRYGRHMQTIAGVHFNYSLPTAFWPAYQELLGDTRSSGTFRSDHYLRLLRNFRRVGWLVLYLFGASPAVCRSFADNQQLKLSELDDKTLYEPYATSLRMSDLGYSNQNQSRIAISLNDLNAYIRDLRAAIRTPEPAYEQIGVKVDGEYRQLSANLLQIENEYYSPIRPKQIARSGERPSAALRRGGIEYVEIRSLDIDLFDPVGVGQNAMRFTEALLVYCMLEDSPPLSNEGAADASWNQTVTARRGREPGLRLRLDGDEIALADWAALIMDKVAAVAELIDRHERTDVYNEAVRVMRERVEDSEATPSARILDELATSGASFFEFAMTTAQSHANYFASMGPMPEARRRLFEEETEASRQRQRDIEAADVLSFDDYLEKYFAADKP